MADELTAEARAAIAAFDRPVTVCPPRTFSDPEVTGQGMALKDLGGISRRIEARQEKFRRAGRGQDLAVAERRSEVARLAGEGLSGPQIAARIGAPLNTVYSDVQAVGARLPTYRGGARPCPSRSEIPAGPRAPAAAEAGRVEGPAVPADDPVGAAAVAGAAAPTGAGAGAPDKAVARRAAAAEGGRRRVRDRRRFKSSPVPGGEPAKPLAPDHPAAVEGRPRFASRVLDPADPETAGESVLKDGAMNAKIGGDVQVGRWAGARIVTLTLAERTTCPRACAHWLSCYGNHDPNARRWLPGAALERRLRAEIAALCARHERVLVRLHYLGDFYSGAYAVLWDWLLFRHPNLAAFGFTAHGPETPTGGLIAATRAAYPGRFSIRHSGRTGRWGAFTIDFPTERKRLGDAVVCPEQRDAMEGTARGRHCGSCAVCWQTDLPIVFVEH